MKLSVLLTASLLMSLFLLDKDYEQPINENVYQASFISDQKSNLSTESIVRNSETDIIFIENLGQIRDTKGNARPDILFHTRSQGIDIYLTRSGISYVFRVNEGNFEDQDFKSRYYRLDMDFEGMNKNIGVKKEIAVQQRFNYYTPEYENGISPNSYKKVTIENLYDGIDLVYYEREGKMKYDFILNAGADPENIKMKYIGAEKVFVDKNGNVIVTTPLGEIREEKPFTYARYVKEPIASSYGVNGNVVHFNVDDYDESEDIIIDPFRQWATYYGGSFNDQGSAVCTDNSGNLYVTGNTASTNFPIKILQGAYNDTTFEGSNTTLTAFILKFNSSGERLWATYYGGSDRDYGTGICTDNSGYLYVTGRTRSPDFPTQSLAGAYNQSTYGGNGGYDAFILKFSSSGVRLWATFYGGSDEDKGHGICTDDSGNLYITGETISSDFPIQTLAGAYNDTTLGGGDVFILKFNSSSERLWATYYGGDGSGGESGYDICSDNSGNLYITGLSRPKIG